MTAVPPITEVGDRVSDETASPLKVTVAVFADGLRVAVIVSGSEDGVKLEVIANVAVVDPAGTVTVDG